MLYHLGLYIHRSFDALGFFRLFGYISFRSIAAALSAILITFLVMSPFIRRLQRKAILDAARETGIPSSFDKAGTPTMGGVVIAFAVLASAMLWCNLKSLYVWYSIVPLLWFGAIGLMDDLKKARRGSGDRGMSEVTKLVLQGMFALLFVFAITGQLSPLPAPEWTTLHAPFLKRPLLSSRLFYGLFVFLFVILVSNSVNITDGLDGLAIMPAIFVVLVLGVFGYVMGNAIYSKYLQYAFLKGAGELTVVCSAFVGAGLGFLWYNSYPAQVFMGDTGSLAIGGLLAAISVLLKQELLFPILGGLFLAEALTSQIQDKIGVRWLGRRLFYRAPLHHSLQYRGLAETKVVIRLWIIAGILALISLATMKIR